SAADLARLRVVCDWIQYKANFRDPVMARPMLGAGLAEGEADFHEIAVDLRQCAAAGAGVSGAMAAALAETVPHSPGRERGAPDGQGRVWLEPWVPGSASLVWRFNALFWQALADWEKASGHLYEQSLPGGQTAARDTAAARDLILGLFKTWDELQAR